MPSPVFLGEFEQLVLLALLQVSRELAEERRAGGSNEMVKDAPVRPVRDRLGVLAGRSISRGALYRTLDRMEEKGWVEWRLDDADVPERGGHPRRHFRVTPEGIDVLRASRTTLLGMWSTLEEVLG